jgi:cytochrome b561
MTPKGYSRTQISLHWGIAALIVAQFVLHDPIVAAWEALAKGENPVIGPLVMAHVIGGSLVLALVVWRLVIRMRRGVPALPEKEAPLLKGLAHLTHWTLYALMVVLPITGLLTWFGGSETADFIHTSLKLPLLGLVVLHFAAALFQQFVLRTGLINRILRADT